MPVGLARGELAQDLEVALHEVRRPLELGVARRIELELGRVDDDVRARQLAHLAELGGRPRRLHRPAAPEDDDLADPRADDRLDRRVRRVGRRELLLRQSQHARDVERDVPVADHDRALRREIEPELLEVRVAVVPGDELGRGPRPRKILARDPEPPVGLRADRVDHRVVPFGELRLRDVAADLDVPDEAEAGSRGDLLERPRDRLQLRMVGRHAEPDEPPRRRQPLDHVHLRARILAREQVPSRVEGRRAGADHGDAKCPAGAVVAHVSPS